jgi:hypothetical protein
MPPCTPAHERISSQALFASARGEEQEEEEFTWKFLGRVINSERRQDVRGRNQNEAKARRSSVKTSGGKGFGTLQQS